jgi:aminoglycoside phosphotransferase (APT) family kinase protein
VNAARPPAVEAAIAGIAAALGLEAPDIAELEGGVANRSFRLRARGQEFVVKLAGEAAGTLGSSRRSAFAMHSLAAHAGLAPPVVLADEPAGILVTRLAPGRVPDATEFESSAMLRRVGAWIARLHALPPPSSLPVVDFGERAAAYLTRLVEQGNPFAKGLLRELERRRATLPAPARLASCHHDLHHRNFIDDGNVLLAVDWEYAGPGDPATDLVSCIGYHGLEGAAVEALLEGYGGAAAELRARIAALGWIFDCLWFGWNATARLVGLAVEPAEQARLAARLAR